MHLALFNPIIALIHNTTADTWHPVVFAESPLPGPDGPHKPVRHKSKGHHTLGFSTREEAEKDAREVLAPKIAGVTLKLDVVFDWDGEGIPAMVAFFDHTNPPRTPAQ